MVPSPSSSLAVETSSAEPSATPVPVRSQVRESAPAVTVMVASHAPVAVGRKLTETDTGPVPGETLAGLTL